MTPELDKTLRTAEHGKHMVNVDSLVTVTDASRIGVSALARRAEAGEDVAILNKGRPTAVFVGIDRLRYLSDLEERVAAREDLLKKIAELIPVVTS
ncbi:MAG TPA: hypothetical protein VG604_01205 [Candidatus Saccharimonadales bacterium]|nr:hypothetical protein [Candidatus Saccharimonadales bacterium]